MKLAFSAEICGGMDWGAIARVGGELGYDGVELNAGDGRRLDVFLTDTTKVRTVFSEANLAIAALCGAVRIGGGGMAEKRGAEDVEYSIRTASRLRCALVKLALRSDQRGGWMSLSMRVGDWLLPLGDVAARNGVTLVLEYGPAARRAPEMWALLERASHPAIACSLNLLKMTERGESPYQAVPTLNQKIQYVQVNDGRRIEGKILPCPLGEGDVPISDLLSRLSGIGYGGFVALGPDVGKEGQAGGEALLIKSIQTLRGWLPPPSDNRALPLVRERAAEPSPLKTAD